MFRKSLVFAVIVTVFSISSYAATIDSSWVGGEDGEWGQASNWNPAVVPDNNATNTFNVTIDGGSNYVDVGLQQHRTINRLDCYGEVELSLWTSDWTVFTLTDPCGLTNHGLLEIDGIEFTGNVTNTNSSRLELDDTEIVGTFINEQDGFIEVITEMDVEGDFTNNGWMFLGPECSGGFWVDEGSFINNGVLHIQNSMFANDETDANFINSVGATIRGSGTIFTENSLLNSGSIVSSADNLKIQVHGTFTNEATGELRTTPGASIYIASAYLYGGEEVLNKGIIVIHPESAITLRKDGMFTSVVPGDYSLNNEGIIQLKGGTIAASTITQTADANFSGFGTISGNVVIETDGLITLTGPTNIIGDVTVSAGATLQISDGQTLITGVTTNNGTIKLIGGTPVFQGGYSGEPMIYEQSAQRSSFDFIRDGVVDFTDFASFADIWLWQASWY